MKIAATGLLVVMAAVFAATRALEPQYPALGWVRRSRRRRWSAVCRLVRGNGLFRHPLGLPIPATAIIPRNKDRIGEALAAFLKEKFPRPAVWRGG